MKILKNKKMYILICVFTLLVLVILVLTSKVKASNKLNGIENFPNSYRPYLEELLKKHPNWNFTALYTNLDWNYVINKENEFGKNLVPKNYNDNWKNTSPDKYNVEIDSGWVDSSKQAVEYCMDPRNFLNEIRIFQFEELSYNSNINSLEGIEKILYGTEFYKTQVSYVDSNGNNINMTERYSDLILKAGQISYVSPYHLASRIKQEVGPFLTHNSISGELEGYKGLYNFYNIGATSSAEPLGAIKNGLAYAKDGKGANEEVRSKYLIPWNTKEKAITGGAIFIGDSYINVGQNTIYLQKFAVNDQRSSNLFWHQYMTNVLAPYSESKSIYNGYVKSGLLNTTMSFIIPVYENMPEVQTSSPDINLSDFISDNTKVYCNATNVNIRTGPSTSYDIITTISNGYNMVRIERGNQLGEKWDKVVLENGIIGYIYQSYVTEVPEAQIEKIDIIIDNTILQKGEYKQLQVNILPQEASNKKVFYSSSNPKIATIDNSGKVKAIRSGETTIIVKSEENNVQNQINITVYSKVTGILLDKQEIYMQIGDTFQVNGQIEPDDANNKGILYSSTNMNIAVIDENGLIEALEEGECIIVGTSKENSEIKSECKLIVIRNIDNDIYFESPLKTIGFEISGIEYDKNTVFNIKQKVKTNFEIEIVNNKNQVLSETDRVGTGSKIILKENGKKLAEYKIILYGDVNGDGKINSIDLLVLQRHILEIESIEEIYKRAGNINKNARNPTSVDLLLIQRHILELQIIEQ